MANDEKRLPAFDAILPAPVRYAPVPPAVKVLYAEIRSRATMFGDCNLSNAEIGELFSANPETVSRWLSTMRERGWITIEHRTDGRKIFITDAIRSPLSEYRNQTPLTKKSRGGLTKKSNPIDEKIKGGMTKKSNPLKEHSGTHSKTHSVATFGDLERVLKPRVSETAWAQVRAAHVAPDGFRDLPRHLVALVFGAWPSARFFSGDEMGHNPEQGAAK